MWPLITAGAGVVVIGFALREIFRDLFQPTGSGSLSSFIGRGVFAIARRARYFLPIAGPISVLISIACWTFLLALGFALVYCSHFPAGFRSDIPQTATVPVKFFAIFCFSLGELTTVSFHDITPGTGWIGLITALEGLLGFSLMTASISWIVLIYPALGRMRSLARHASDLTRAQEETGIPVISDDSAQLLCDLAQDVIRTRVDFIHFPLIYYFHADSERASLPSSLGRLLDWTETASSEERTDRVRFASAFLEQALRDMAGVLAHRFVHVNPKDTKAVFRAFAKDHLDEKDAEGRRRIGTTRKLTD